MGAGVTVDSLRIKDGLIKIDKCFVKKTGTQSINNGTDTKIAWDSEDSDEGGWHDNVTNNTRITVPVTATYRISVSIEFVTNGTGGRFVNVFKNGVAIPGASVAQATASFVTVLTLSYPVDLQAGDYLEVNVYQASGGALNVSNGNSFFRVEKVSN